MERVQLIPAFTLAEVLITLGIIGIVAAMTMPNIVRNYRNKVLKEQFKVAYSLVNQAVQRMSIDNPDLMNTYCGTSYSGSTSDKNTLFAEDFSKYFDVVKDNTLATGNESFKNIYGKDLNQPNYKKYSKPPDNNGYNDGSFVIKNGMIILNGYCWLGAQYKKGQRVEFLVDTNGLKGPNAMGYDLFYFWIDEKNQLVTCPQIGDRPQYCNFLTEDTTGAHNGVNCSTFALRDQFPHDETKPYWESLP